MMTSRQRVLTTLGHREPDRVPFNLRADPVILDRFRAEVVAGVCRTLRTMAPGGGYIAAPCHTLTEEVPWENILAFHQALREHGAYPNPGGR